MKQIPTYILTINQIVINYTSSNNIDIFIRIQQIENYNKNSKRILLLKRSVRTSTGFIAFFPPIVSI